MNWEKGVMQSRCCHPRVKTTTGKQIVGSRQTQVLSYKTSMSALVNAFTTQ